MKALTDSENSGHPRRSPDEIQWPIEPQKAIEKRLNEEGRVKAEVKHRSASQQLS